MMAGIDMKLKEVEKILYFESFILDYLALKMVIILSIIWNCLTMKKKIYCKRLNIFTQGLQDTITLFMLIKLFLHPYLVH